MVVRAKFKCMSKTQHESGAFDARLVPVHGGKTGNPENAEFYKWTPSGEITIRTISPSAAAAFEPGGFYYVDFTRCDEVASDGVPSGS